MVKRKRFRLGTVSGLIAVSIAFSVWAIVVAGSAAGWDVFHVAWNYERTGQLGDSFGVVSAVMTSLAALFTYLTMQEEKSENERLKAKERQSERREKDSLAEATFFRLIEARRSLVESINFSEAPGKAGQAAFDLLIHIMPEIHDASEAKGAFGGCYDANGAGLGHYFRFTYHVVRFVDENFSSNRKRYELVRLLRAQMSNSELVLTGLNCAFGEGYRAFRPLAQKYALFHNIPKEQQGYYCFKPRVHSSAFSSSMAKKELGITRIIY